MAEQGQPISRRGRVGRAAPLIGMAGRTAGEAVVESLRKRRRGQEGSDFHERNAQRYADYLGNSKGVLMKAGQILSFTSFGQAVDSENQTVYQRALARLQDTAPPMPYDTAAQVVAEELGDLPEKVFAQFDPTPIGAASIGQVHCAVTHEGRRVAVKIQYPGVAQAIRADLQNTELLATFLQILKGFVPGITRLDVKAVAQEVSTRIGEEIDYRVEAANQLAFADGYRGHPFIRIPEVLPELSTGRVLTMEYADGRRFAEAIDCDREMRDVWGEVVHRFAVGSIRRLGLLHADPHPGNYLFHDDGSVTFLDFGCIKRFDEAHVRNMQAALNAAIDGDAPGTVTALGRMGIVDPDACRDAETTMTWFRIGLEALTEAQPYTYTPEHSSRIVPEKYSPTGPHSSTVRKVSLDPEYVMITRIDLGMTAIMAALGPTGPWEAIRSEWDRGGPAATPMGELDAQFWGASV